MTSPGNNQQDKTNDKELNFRKQEEKYERMLAQERAEKERILKELNERTYVMQTTEDDDDDDEPYVDHKKLNKKLSKFNQSTQSEIHKAMEQAKQAAKEEMKKEVWIESNPDFYDVLQNHAERFAMKAPKLAETILKMPEGFERQKLVYQNIKELGLDKPEQKQPSIQEKIDANKRSPYYQPTGVGSAPYASAADFSAQGQKNAYDKLIELKNRMRLG